MLKFCLLGFLVFATVIFLAGSGIGLTGVTMAHYSQMNSVNHVVTAQDERTNELTSAEKLIEDAEQEDNIDLSTIQGVSDVQMVIKEQGERTTSLQKKV